MRFIDDEKPARKRAGISYSSPLDEDLLYRRRPRASRTGRRSACANDDLEVGLSCREPMSRERSFDTYKDWDWENY